MWRITLFIDLMQKDIFCCITGKNHMIRYLQKNKTENNTLQDQKVLWMLYHRERI